MAKRSRKSGTSGRVQSANNAFHQWLKTPFGMVFAAVGRAFCIPTVISALVFLVLSLIEKYADYSLDLSFLESTLFGAVMLLLAFIITSFFGKTMDSNTDIVDRIADFTSDMKHAVMKAPDMRYFENYKRLVNMALEDIVGTLLDISSQIESDPGTVKTNSFDMEVKMLHDMLTRDNKSEAAEKLLSAHKAIESVSIVRVLSKLPRVLFVIRCMTYTIIGLMWTLVFYGDRYIYVIPMVFVISLLYEVAFTIITDINQFDNPNKTESRLIEANKKILVKQIEQFCSHQ